MNVPILQGSPRANGNTSWKAEEYRKAAEAADNGNRVFFLDLLIRKLDFSGVLYRRIVRPLSEASYGTYLLHMLVLVPVVDCFRQHLSPAATMIASAVATYVLASAAGVLLRRIPFAGRFIAG